MGLVHHNSGKTCAGAHKLLDVHFYNAVLPDGSLTGVPSAALAPTYKALNDFTVPALLDAADALGLSPIRKRSITIGNNQMEDVLVFPEFSSVRRPSYILLRTAERPELIAGWEVGCGWADEPTRWKEDHVDPKNDPLLQFMGRIRHPKARIKIRLFTYTNEGDATRVFQMARAGMPAARLFRFSTRDNPAMRQYVEDLEAVLTEEQVAQYVDGEAMKLRGVTAYSSFDDDVHVAVGGLEFVRGIPISIALDFNIEPGMHLLVGQYSRLDDEFRFIDEIHERRLALDGAIDLLEDRYGDQIRGWGLPLRVYGDPAGSAAWSGTGQTHYQIVRKKLGEYGIPYEIQVAPGHAPVVDRVNCVNQAFRDGRGVHIQIDPRCVRFIDDLRRQRWDNRGKLTTDSGTIGHAGDAGGYWVMEERPIRVERSKPAETRIGFVG